MQFPKSSALKSVHVSVSLRRTAFHQRSQPTKKSHLPICRSSNFAEITMPAQGALSPVYRAQETQFAARGGERLAYLPVSPWTSVSKATHGSRLLAVAILRRRPGDQDLQRLLRAVSRLNYLRHLRNRASWKWLGSSLWVAMIPGHLPNQPRQQRTAHTFIVRPRKKKNDWFPERPTDEFCLSFQARNNWPFSTCRLSKRCRKIAEAASKFPILATCAFRMTFLQRGKCIRSLFRNNFFEF